jgi:hypothetical protein
MMPSSYLPSLNGTSAEDETRNRDVDEKSDREIIASFKVG